MNPLLTVLRDRYVHGWPGHDEGEPAFVVPLETALTRPFTTDAHLGQYVTPNGRRLRAGAVDHHPIELHTIFFDIDCAAVHGTSEPAPESWRAEQLERVGALQAVHPGAFAHETRGGFRVLYKQAAPTILRCAEDARKWRQDYAVCVAYLERFGIAADRACSDWTRLFRAPLATRDGELQRRPTYGDPCNVGELVIDATEADLARAQELLPSAWSSRRITGFTPGVTGGRGLLWHLLNARGDVKRERANGACVVRCPNESEHTTGSSADGSTVLFPPAEGERTGLIICKHTHCTDRRVGEWLRYFSDCEIKSAEQAAGLAQPNGGKREAA